MKVPHLGEGKLDEHHGCKLNQQRSMVFRPELPSGTSADCVDLQLPSGKPAFLIVSVFRARTKALMMQSRASTATPSKILR